jgi:hypothetical protein
MSTVLQIVQAVQVFSNINWKGIGMSLSNVLKWVKTDKAIVAIVAAVGLLTIGGGVLYLAAESGRQAAENAELRADVALLQEARVADRLATEARERGRAAAAVEYEARAVDLAVAAEARPDWAADRVPDGVLEALR